MADVEQGRVDRRGALSAPAGRSTENFDRDWRFARFGLQPDGSCRPEPGQDKTFNGLALVIVRTQREQPGTFTVTAVSERLQEASQVLTSR